MRGKSTIIISSLIMCLALIVAAVFVTAAWFGDVNSKKLSEDLEINSGTVAALTGVSMASGNLQEQSLVPAVAEAGAFGNAKAYPGNYFVGAAGETYSVEKATSLDPSKSAPEGIKTKAKSVQFVLSMRYDDPAVGADESVKTVKLLLGGVYFEKDLTKDESGKYAGYEIADGLGRNFKNEFNVKMTLVSNGDGTGEPVSQDVVKFDNSYTSDNPFGHIITVQAQPAVTYFVKFEIYFNKVDEECDPELTRAKLVLNIKLDAGTTSSPSEP